MRGIPRAGLVVAALGAVACINPVHQDEVAALGGEVNNETPGEDHRPGQPCLVCHGGQGPGPDFAIAGTVYRTRGVGGEREAALARPRDGSESVTVVLTDAARTEHRNVANGVGNFFVRSNDWAPVYPVRVRLEYRGSGKTADKEMVSFIGRNGGCASCHHGKDNEPSHMPPVFMFDK